MICACGITSIKLEGNVGVTIGGSAVGFAHQMYMYQPHPVCGSGYCKRSWAQEKKEKCGLVWQDYDGYSRMLTLAGSGYLALD